MAAKTKKSTALVKWDAQLAERSKIAAKLVDEIASGGNMIGTKNGVLSYKNAKIPGNKMNVVVLSHVLHNAFYKGKFDPNNPKSPDCYAFGMTKKEMAPHEKVAKPENDDCASCPQNEFGTADTGRGKACKNTCRLGLISQSDLEDIEGAEVAYIHVPVTSVKAWAGYVRELEDVMHRPPLGVVTEISLHPDDETQFTMEFKLIDKVEDEYFEALFPKADKVDKDITFPYVVIENQKPAAKAGRKVVPQAKGKAAAAAAGKRAKF